jgi:uncharacterized membrane protein (TIGR02234 family)
MADPAPRSRPRRLFWPIVLLGVAGSVLAAIAGDHQWRTLGMSKGQTVSFDGPSLDSPATTALALVCLAAWGVFLVTRGLVRRALAVLAALAAAGTVATTFSRPDGTGEFTVTSAAPVSAVHLSTTAWPWVALLGSLLALAAAVLALLWSPRWPEMGRRYDAPTTPGVGPVDLSEAEPIELWKTMSEGHDPTSDGH